MGSFSYLSRGSKAVYEHLATSEKCRPCMPYILPKASINFEMIVSYNLKQVLMILKRMADCVRQQ